MISRLAARVLGRTRTWLRSLLGHESSDAQARVAEDTFALVALRPLCPGYLPISSSALRPSALMFLVNDIVVNSRRSAIEFGAGSSTIFLAAALQQIGGHLTSVEHDQDWLAVVRGLLERHSLADSVTLLHAPLEPIDPVPAMPESHTWYAHDRLASATRGRRFDFALVDGPPAYAAGFTHQRYPALPFLLPMLADRCMLALDDIDRPGETAVVQQWQALAGMVFRRDSSTGLAVGIRGPAYHC